MSNHESNSKCAEVWSAIAAREYRDWEGLPAFCGYPDFDAAFARLRDEYGQGNLGNTNLQAMYRIHVAKDYPHNLKVWFRGEDIVLIEIRYLILPYPSYELLQQFSEPQVRLDYYLDVMRVPKGAWVYPSRGLTLFLDAGRTEVMWIALFHSCSLAEYLDTVHPNTQMWELPTRE
jgi:hypothetical protein